MHTFNVTIVPNEAGSFEPLRAHLQYATLMEVPKQKDEFSELLDEEDEDEDGNSAAGSGEGEEEMEIVKVPTIGRSSSLGRVLIVSEADHIRKTSAFVFEYSVFALLAAVAIAFPFLSFQRNSLAFEKMLAAPQAKKSKKVLSFFRFLLFVCDHFICVRL